MHVTLLVLKEGFRRYGVLMVLYTLSSFIQMFPLVSVGLVLNIELQCTAADLSFYYATVFIPWNFRALFGLLSDAVPVFGSRRKIYICVAYSVVAGCLITFGQCIRNLGHAYAVGIVMNVFFALSETVLDAVAVEHARSSGTAGSDMQAELHTRSVDIQSAAMMFRTLGSLIAVPIPGGLSTFLAARTIIPLTAIFPLVALIVSLCSSLEKTGTVESVHKKAKKFLEYVRICIRERRKPTDLFKAVGDFLLPCLFILLYASCPTSAVAFSNYLFTQLKFTPAEYHAISLCGTVGSLVGTIVYWKSFRKSTTVKSGFVVSIIISAFAAGSRLLILYGWESIYFVCADELLVNLAFRLTLMPVQVYASIAANAPENLMFEGFVFGLFASIENWGGTLSGIFSGLLASRVSLATLIIVSGGLSFVPLLGLSLLKPYTPVSDDSKEDPIDSTGDTQAEAI